MAGGCCCLRAWEFSREAKAFGIKVVDKPLLADFAMVFGDASAPPEIPPERIIRVGRCAARKVRVPSPLILGCPPETDVIIRFLREVVWPAQGRKKGLLRKGV